MVCCCMFLFPQIWARPLDQRLCSGVLRSGHCPLANGLLLNVFISCGSGQGRGINILVSAFSDPGIAPWWMVYCCIFLFHRIQAQPLDHHLCPGILKSGHCCPANGWLLYFVILSDPGTAAGSSLLSRRSQIQTLPPDKWFIVVFFVSSDPGTAT